MDDGESFTPKIRKRTESIGGSSDSELSEGWNIVDQTDVTSQDVPSSDGESVEVIDAEDESRENPTDTEVEGDGQLAALSDSPVGLVPITEPEVPAVPSDPPQEPVFDSSFRWFLIYATAAVLFANITFLIAENVFTWNTDSDVEAPSFLRDLPTTPKLLNGNSLVQNIPWADAEETKETFRDQTINDENLQKHEVNKKQSYEANGERYNQRKNDRFNKQNEKYHKQQNEYYDKHGNEQYKKQVNEKYNKQHNENYNKKKNENYQHIHEGTHYHKFDHELGKYFKTLSEATTSFETKGKLNQVFLILDALHIGLNDLDEVVTENSELQSVLRKQKHKLSQVLTEIEYGVSKSLDRVASNVLNKVGRLERRFEQEWCELEKRGHQEELKGLFYDCRENEEKAQSEHGTDSQIPEEIKYPNDASGRDATKIDLNWNSYEYQVDKDSPGKEHRNTHGNEAKDMDDYYMLVKSEMQNNVEPLEGEENDHYNRNTGEFSLPGEDNKSNNNEDKTEIFTNEKDKKKITDDRDMNYEKVKHDNGKRYDGNNSNFESKEKYDKQKQKSDQKKSDGKRKSYNDNEKHHDDEGKLNDKGKNYDEGKHYDDKRRHYDEKKKHTDDRVYNKGHFTDGKTKYDDKRTYAEEKRKHRKFETYKSTEYPSSDHTNDRGQAKSEKSEHISEPELIRKYLKESCEKGRNKFNNMYEKLKSFIDSKLRVPKKMFDSLFAKYCQVNDDSYKWEKRFNREHPKGDFNGKNSKTFFKDELVIGDNVNKNVRIIDITEVSPEDDAPDPVSDNMIIPNSKPRQWVFSHDEPLNDNKSNLTGDWFFKAGESRSKMRWSHHRGDWWFDRAYHRRTQSRPNWFSSKHKNWYFRRAWARQNCLNNPRDSWCHFSEEETVTVPNSSTNFR